MSTDPQIVGTDSGRTERAQGLEPLGVILDRVLNSLIIRLRQFAPQFSDGLAEA